MGIASVIIKIGAQTAEAVSNIERVNKAVGETQTTGQKMQAGIEKAAIPAAAAMTALVAIGVKSAKAAAEDQASREQLDSQIRRSTDSTNTQIAANEKWIDTVSKSVAVADDDLRPALAGLVRTTGDVTKAHGLMTSALDLAAATGKPLASTSAALAKAYTGSYGALTKLDPALKNVAVSGADFATVQAALNTQVAGAAKGEAETAAGQYRAMQISIQELQESIGMALLPALQAVLPVVTQFVGVIGGHTNVIVAFGAAIATVSGIILAANVGLKVYRAAVIAWSAATKIATAVTKAYEVASIALNVVWAASPIGLVVVAVIALAAAIVLAYRHSATFRAVVQSAFSAAKQNVLLLLGPLGLIVRAFQLAYQNSATFRNIVTAAMSAIEAAINLVISAIGRLTSALSHIHVPHIDLPGPLSVGMSGGAAVAGYGVSPYAAAPVYQINVTGAIDPEATAQAIRRVLERSDRRRGRGYQAVQPWQ